MRAQCGATFAAVRSVAFKIYLNKANVAAGAVLLAMGGVVSGCAVPVHMARVACLGA